MGSIFWTALIILLTLGAIAYYAEKTGVSKESGKTPGYALLPGDIKYESPSGNFKFYFPITTSIVLSVVLSVLLRILG